MNTDKLEMSEQPRSRCTIQSIVDGPAAGGFDECVSLFTATHVAYLTADEVSGERSPRELALIEARFKAESAAWNALLSIVNLHTAIQVAEALTALQNAP